MTTFVEALEADNPAQALHEMAEASRRLAFAKSEELKAQLEALTLPPVIANFGTATACADSIFASLSKIASGGSQASQEIRDLEERKAELDQQALAVGQALQLRQDAGTAAQAAQREQWTVAADSLARWVNVDDLTRAYAGDFAIQQLQQARDTVQEQVVRFYKTAVENGDLLALGQLTPVLASLQEESLAVKLYLQFLQKQLKFPSSTDWKVEMPVLYNSAVALLRHHLPLVSHCLYKADGDVAVLQLIHSHVEHAAIPLLQSYQEDAQLQQVSKTVNHVSSMLQESLDNAEELEQLGTLQQINSLLEELALAIQHCTQYLRFVQHAGDEISKARQLRGQDSVPALSNTLHQAVAELGGHYAAIEHCLLLASIQHASQESDFRVMKEKVLQTTVVDTSLFAARQSTLRALATGHTGTASAMVNFCSDSLRVLLQLTSQRAEQSVALLKSKSSLVSWTPQHHKEEPELLSARACAALNDLEVAALRTGQLETALLQTIDRSYPPCHETEQLLMCAKSLSICTDSFRLAANATMESLESVLRPRLRSIVGEAVGEPAGFMMGSTVMGPKAADRVTSRMNYKLDEEAYNLHQLSEGCVARLGTLLDDLLDPLRDHLAAPLWDMLFLAVMATVCKRLEASLRKCEFTSLGALTLDSDMRDLLAYTKDRLHSAEYSSNVAVTKACPPLARLLQIAKLLNVDDLEDVLDLITSSKRKNNWDLKLDDTKMFLSARVEFDASRVSELLRLPNDD